MARTECPECRKPVSARAETCPHCGAGGCAGAEVFFRREGLAPVGRGQV